MLTSANVDYIIKDLNYRGIVAEEIQDELIDHVCSAVEAKISEGKNFIEAYQEVLETFGHTAGLQETQTKAILSKDLFPTTMFKNHMTIALRNLRKQRFYTFINVLGLAVGISACLVIMLYVNNELSYDRHHADADRIYRVDAEIKFGANHLKLAVSPGPMAEGLRNDLPEIEHACRFWNDGSVLVKRVDQNIKEADAIYADSSIFNVFTIPLLTGDPKTALKEPNTMVISRSTAEKYFPGENAVGQTLIIENKTNYQVTGIFEDMPTASHFHFNMMLSLVTIDYNKDGSWLSNNFSTYVKLRPGSDYKTVNAKFPILVDKYAGPQAKLALGGDFTMEKFRASGNIFEWRLRPMTDIHLHSDMLGELDVNSNITYVYLFSAVALFILAIACINFMNLSTARSANRAKEVGVRKVMGSMRSHLVRQFLTESTLLTAFSIIIALLLAFLLLPAFNQLSGKTLTLPFGDPMLWIILATATVIIGLMSGLYPSFFLSAFKPVNVLKGNVALGMKSGGIRSGLVVFQFLISIILIIGTLTVNEQLAFIQHKKIGFNKDQVIIIKDAYGMGSHRQLEAFKQEVLKDSHIISGTVSGFLPVSGTNRSDNTHWPEGTQPTAENMVSLQCWRVDYDYLKTLDMNVVSGRGFSKEFLSDSGGVILNQAALKLFGITGDPIGKKISSFKGDPNGANNERITVSYPIIGVVEDFHFESMRESITPLGFFLARSIGLVSFRFQPTHTKEVIQQIEKTWRAFAPGMPFSYSFLDEDFGKMYEAEGRLGKLFVVFAALAIIIASLGLFALSAFTAEQRTKEIGIRKVLGASISSIVVLLSREFGKLILISFVLAIPIAWYAIDWWLKGYTYKVEIGVLVYLIAGFSSFAIAWLTMGYQSIRAAMANPVNSLRSE